MDGDDLDDDLALFESQIQQVKAATTASVPQAPAKARSSNQPPKPEQAHPSSSSQPQPQTSLPSSTASATPQPDTQTTGRWVWDGTTWRWRTTSTPTAPKPLASSDTAPVPVGPKKPTTTKRTAAGQVWQDATLGEFPADDHRLFVGDLAPDATEKQLSDAFSVYASFAMARIVRDKRSGACRGYGFVSFLDGHDMVRALRELNGTYVGGRPVKLKRSSWQKRALKGEKWKELKAFQRIAKG